MPVIRLLLFCTLVGFTLPSVAATVSVKGIGAVQYDSWSLPDEKKAEARELARANAIERYIARQSTSKSQNFDIIRSEVEDNPGQFTLGDRIVSENHDEDAKRYQVVVRAEINTSRLANALEEASAVGAASSAEKSYITFVFVAREKTAVKSYEAKEVERKDTDTYVEGSDQQATSSSGVEYASSESTSEKTTTGGSTTRKADVARYQVSRTEGINSVTSGVFSSRGFKVVEAGFLEDETGGLLSVEAFKNDYRNGDDISSQTLRNAAKGARNVDVPYIAVGTLDVGMQDKDPASGLDRIHVTVSGKIISVKNRFPETVASVGPVQFAGTGPNSSVARTNALKKAADSAAKELTEQLNARGMQ